jgi:hypothetical protein
VTRGWVPTWVGNMQDAHFPAKGLAGDAARSDALAASIAPSWFAFFGPPQVEVGRDAAPASTPQAHQAAVRAITAARPTTREKAPTSQRKVAAAPDAVELPTSELPWGKIAGAAIGVGALIAAVVFFTRGSESEPAKDPAARPTPSARAASADVKPSAPAPVAAPVEKPKPTVAPDPPKPEPEPAPEPAKTEPEPKAPPTPKGPTPAPSPKPKQPPGPKPKGGGIVRDAPF